MIEGSDTEVNRMPLRPRTALQREIEGAMDQGAIKGAMIVTSDGSGSKLLIREHNKERWMIHAIIDKEASDGLG